MTTKKLNLSDIKQGKLVDTIHQKTVEFIHEGESYSTDICIKQLPFAVTQPLYKCLDDDDNTDDSFVNEWIALALVDDSGQPEFTAEQVGNVFIQPLANAVFNAILGIDSLKKLQPMLSENDKETTLKTDKSQV